MEAQAEVPAHCCRTGPVPAAPLTPSQGHWTTETPAGTAPRTRQQESMPNDALGPWQESASARQTPEGGEGRKPRQRGWGCSSQGPQAPRGTDTNPWAASGPGTDLWAAIGPGTDPWAANGPGTDLWAASGPGANPWVPSDTGTDPLGNQQSRL